jgi:hypothetical protein
MEKRMEYKMGVKDIAVSGQLTEMERLRKLFEKFRFRIHFKVIHCIYIHFKSTLFESIFPRNGVPISGLITK